MFEKLQDRLKAAEGGEEGAAEGGRAAATDSGAAGSNGDKVLGSLRDTDAHWQAELPLSLELALKLSPFVAQEKANAGKKKSKVQFFECNVLPEEQAVYSLHLLLHAARGCGLEMCKPPGELI
eukprot:2015142-Rhodomonas_salina.1